MTPATKAVVIDSLTSDLANAEDDLHRARHRFDPVRWNVAHKYGSSGKTGRQILQEYEDRHHALTMALAEVKALP